MQEPGPLNLTDRKSQLNIISKQLLNGVKNCPCGQQKYCLAKGLSEASLESLQTVARHRKFLRGQPLFRLEDDLKNLFVVKSGAVKTYLLDIEGAEQITGFHFPGDIMGLDAITESRHPSSAIALEESIICTLPYDHFKIMCELTPELHLALDTKFSAVLQQAHELLLIINNKSAEERVAFFLMDYAFRVHLTGAAPLKIHFNMSRAEIGNYLGLASETVSRILTNFEHKKLIDVNHRNITLNNLPALKHYVSGCSLSLNKCAQLNDCQEA